MQKPEDIVSIGSVVVSNIRHIPHQEIDFTKWDQAILNSPFPLVFAQSFYLNATFPGWDALVIGDYESAFPLTQRHKLGIAYLHQPPFTPQLGVYGKINGEIEKQFYDYITSRYKLIEIELNAANRLQTADHSPKTTYVIDYAKGYKQNQNTKRNISKAHENQLFFEEVPRQEVLTLSQQHLNPFLTKQLRLSPVVVDRFQALLDSAIAANALYTFRVTDAAQRLQAIAHFISNGKHTVYLKGINFDKETSLGSMHLLNSSAITFFADKTQIFDFGGGMKESLATFYKGFGAQPLTYESLKYNRLPWLLNALKKLS